MPFGNEGVETGIGLAMSGGGFRATLFHIGTLWRLNELAYLPKLNRISTVSGGSITAGVLALRWNELTFGSGVATNFNQKIVEPLRKFCERTIDAWAIGEGSFLPWKTVSEAVQEEYEEHLFKNASLQKSPDSPRFVFNTTNFQTGNDFRFSKPYAGDYRLGLIPSPNLRLSLAVTASSAFPPFLSPVMIELPAGAFQNQPGADLHGKSEFSREIYLTDGGVYDNLGLETVWNRYDTILVSDAGAPLQPEGDIDVNWAGQSLRALDITTNQARALRKRALIDDYLQGRRKGSYWGIRTNIKDYGLIDSLPCDPVKAAELAKIRTRLNQFSEREQSELINFGYALCDAAMRRYVISQRAAIPPNWPYPAYKLE